MDLSHRVIYMNTFSKSLAPAIRISYMVLPRKLMEHYIARANFYSNSASSCEQYALARFIENGSFERHLSRLKSTTVWRARGFCASSSRAASFLPPVSPGKLRYPSSGIPGYLTDGCGDPLGSQKQRHQPCLFLRVLYRNPSGIRACTGLKLLRSG